MAENEAALSQWETDLPETGLFKVKVFVALAIVIAARGVVYAVDTLAGRH